MKFEKGTKESILWEYMHYNIFDDLDSIVDYSNHRWLDRLMFCDGVLKEDVEIIVKIKGKVQPDCWEK
jgi:hypothetical protein